MHVVLFCGAQLCRALIATAGLGTALAFMAALLVVGAMPASAATNDNFANAKVVTIGTAFNSVNSAGFTKEAGEPVASGGFPAGGGCSAWWVWTATFTGPVAASTKGSNFDTVLDVWTGTQVNALSRVNFNDDYQYGDPVSGSGTASRTSMCVFNAIINTVYHIRVDGYATGGSGIIDFSLQAVPTATIAMTTPALEGSTAGVWTVSLSSTLVDQVPVYWTVTPGTEPAANFTVAQTSPLFIPSQTASGTISVTTIDDGVVTGNQTIINTLSATSFLNYVIGGSGAATLTVVDAESPFVYVSQAATGGANTGTSWANAFTDLHAGLANAVSGNILWVAQGTYTTNSPSDSFQMVAGATMFGGFQGNETALSQRNRFLFPTVLSGSSGSGPSQNVVLGTSNATIDGFTITGGAASASSGLGGGLNATGVSGLTITRCTFIGNSASFAGGAIYIYSSGSGVAISDCYFTGNTCTCTSGFQLGGGALFIDLNTNSSAVTNCVFANNTSANTAAGGGGGAVYVWNNTSCAFTNCTFYQNSSPLRAAAGAGARSTIWAPASPRSIASSRETRPTA